MSEAAPAPEVPDGGSATGRSEPVSRSPLRRVFQVAAVAVVSALLGLLIWKVVAGNPGAGFAAEVRAGKNPAAPDFALPVIWRRDLTWPSKLRPALDDGSLALAELRGYPVVLNFWASWCIPCKEEAPDLAAAARKYSGRVAFVGIDIQDFVGDARRFLREVEAPYVSVRETGSKTHSAYGLTGVPETFYIDSSGKAVSRSIGGVTLAEIEAGIAKAQGNGS